MPTTTRYFSIKGPAAGLTPSQLKRSSRTTKIEYMKEWFGRYYWDPANETPYNSREGGYQWVWGGPFNAYDELFGEFGNLVDDNVIQSVARDIEEEDGILDWAPTSRHPVRREEEPSDDDEDEIEERTTSPQEKIDSALRLLDAGSQPSFGTTEDREGRKQIEERLTALEAEIAKLKRQPAHGGMGHNNPPPDLPADDEKLLEEAAEAAAEIKEELKKDAPDAKKVGSLASRFGQLSRWVAEKIGEKALEKVGEKIMESTIVGTAVAALGAFALGVMDKIGDWLWALTLPF